MKPHGIMFHHFHDDGMHIRGQGSISAEKFEQMICFLQKDKTILSAAEWFYRAQKNQLRNNEICITFDDNLKCQFDIAFPVLESLNITAFWFVYTSPLIGIIEKLEVFRYFRFKYFEDIDKFYHSFFNYLNQTEYKNEIIAALSGFVPNRYLSDFPFYTENDRTFRYLRDCVLKPDRFNKVMEQMLKDYNVELSSLKDLLWMNEKDVRMLNTKGHIVGLHTHTHPTSTASLSKIEQIQEYQTNMDELTRIIGNKPYVMSHPCNSYNEDTIDVLKELKVQLGFRSNMKDGFHSKFEYPREDHSNILKQMELNGF
ncbi:polysaccharide deacetylase [Paenibacillus polymyxa]|uniref:polysaccharide deacetylase family protein n=1 Tax=Paenibacillus polymyxa TaxID=1406 RepID=UPI0010BE2C00|nr:polysaccharide deacetylase family protein [Paenibacillus polymyxa]TKH33539.1 polysaccharide deacetylase [Paenibacillus polymyxa]